METALPHMYVVCAAYVHATDAEPGPLRCAHCATCVWRVVGAGGHWELLERGGRYAELWAKQATVDDLGATDEEDDADAAAAAAAQAQEVTLAQHSEQAQQQGVVQEVVGK